MTSFAQDLEQAELYAGLINQTPDFSFRISASSVIIFLISSAITLSLYSLDPGNGPQNEM